MRFAANLALTLVSMSALSGTAWATDHFIGTWKFNKAKSQIGSSTGKYQARTMVVITGTEKAEHLVLKNTLADWTTSHSECDDIFDGKERPVPDADAKGAVFVALRVNSNTRTLYATSDGKLVRIETDVVSIDGKTLTQIVTDLSLKEVRIGVYERQ